MSCLSPSGEEVIKINQLEDQVDNFRNKLMEKHIERLKAGRIGEKLLSLTCLRQPQRSLTDEDAENDFS